MISQTEFVKLSNMSSKEFWRSVRGKSFAEALLRRNQFQRALAEYGKHTQLDEIQKRAIRHVVYMESKLWHRFREISCEVKVFSVYESRNKKIERCLKHGSKMFCRKEFEEIMGKASF